MIIIACPECQRWWTPDQYEGWFKVGDRCIHGQLDCDGIIGPIFEVLGYEVLCDIRRADSTVPLLVLRDHRKTDA